jgi:A1 cistron-splicing factor AAR2
MEPGHGILAVVGLPVGYNFGIDLRMWQTGERFSGIRGIPDGIHYISYSSPDDEMRQGFFIVVSPASGMIVRVWNPSTETLEPPTEPSRRSEIECVFLNDFRYITSLAPFDTCLGEEAIGDWRTASRFITPELIDRIQPVNAQHFHSRPQPSADREQGDMRTIFFSHVGKPTPPKNASQADVTRFHINRTEHLEQFLTRSKYHNELDIIGEIQAAFILFLLGLNYDAFVQWRKLTELILGCSESGISQHPDLFTAAASALTFQIKQMPGDLLFDAGISDDDMEHRRNQKNVFILPLVSQFVISCSDESLLSLSELQNGIQQLDKLMAEKYGDEWTSIFNPEENDDPPIVVDIS